MPDGKPENKFAFDGQCKTKVRICIFIFYFLSTHQSLFSLQAHAEAVIHETHEAWKRLIDGKTPNKSDTHDISV